MEALDDRGALQLEFLPLLTRPTSVTSRNSLASFDLRRGLAARTLGRKPLKMAAWEPKVKWLGAIARCRGPCLIHRRSGTAAKAVVTTGIEGDQQHRIRVEGWCSHSGGSSSSSSSNRRMLSRQLRERTAAACSRPRRRQVSRSAAIRSHHCSSSSGSVSPQSPRGSPP